MEQLPERVTSAITLEYHTGTRIYPGHTAVLLTFGEFEKGWLFFFYLILQTPIRLGVPRYGEAIWLPLGHLFYLVK